MANAEERRLRIPAVTNWYVDPNLSRNYLFHVQELGKRKVKDPLFTLRDMAIRFYAITTELSEQATVTFNSSVNVKTREASEYFPFCGQVRDDYTISQTIQLPKQLTASTGLTELQEREVFGFLLSRGVALDERLTYLALLDRHDFTPGISALFTNAFRWYDRVWWETKRGNPLVSVENTEERLVANIETDFFKY